MGLPLIELIASLVMLLHVIVCPFTKVEESFNIQAVHDILYHGVNIDQYDHLEFPGVVPRTFIGPAVLAVATAPAVYVSFQLKASKLLTQYMVRIALGVFVMFGLSAFGNAVKEKYGADAKRLMFLITMTQFHFMFYMTRTLPNTFALALVLFALASWLQQQHARFIWLSGASIVIFRAELVAYLGLILLSELFSQRLKIMTFLKHLILGGTVLLGFTVLFDSFFWKRWLWPEGEVLWYNTVLNKSSKWGTQPFLWYFLSALPRALSLSFFLIPIGLNIEARLRPLIIPATGFIFLYSNLPHKELRFIIYVLPVFNVVSAVAVSRLWANRSKSWLQRIAGLAAVSHLLGNILTTAVFLFVSQQNYPGGHAMIKIHQMEPASKAVNLHVDVATAQTGVTRFTQENTQWRYNKTEDLKHGGKEMLEFTHIFVGDDDVLQYYKDTHSVIAKIDGFDSIKFDPRSFPPIKIGKRPKIWILKRDKFLSGHGS